MIGLLFVGWKKTGQDRKWIIQVFRGLQTAIFKMFWFITWSQEELALAYPNLFRLLWKSALPCSFDPLSEDPVFMLKKCTWQGKLVNCSDIFTPVITDSGVCCAFNHRSNLKDSVYSQLVKEMQGARDQEDKEASTVTSGIGRGLQVILDQNMDRWVILVLWTWASADLCSGWARSLSSHPSLDSDFSLASPPSSHFSSLTIFSWPLDWVTLSGFQLLLSPQTPEPSLQVCLYFKNSRFGSLIQAQDSGLSAWQAFLLLKEVAGQLHSMRSSFKEQM